MPQTDITTDQDEDAKGRQLIQELQGIGNSLAEHARRHPKDTDFRAARAELERAIHIAIEAGSKPHSDQAAETWLGYAIDEYARIVRADACMVAQQIYG